MFEARPAGQRLTVLTCALILAACASPGPSSNRSSSGGSKVSSWPDRDGPDAVVPPDLKKVPDAVPKLESIRKGGPNKPYEVLGERYEPIAEDKPLVQKGLASWYGRKFHGKPTSSGEIYNMYAMTAAHATIPIPSYARVRNPKNGREIIVRINDRGPFHKGRIIDLSYTAALKLDLLRGVAPVEVKRITYAEIRAGLDVTPANEPPPVFVPATPPGGPLRETTGGTATSPGYWLQFGAFTKLDGAEAMRQRIAEADLGMLPLLTIVREAGLHRLRAGPFPSADEARATATRLRDEGGIESTLIEKR